MSIEYTIYEDDDPQGKVLLTLSLSNSTHSAWQDEVGLKMKRVNPNDPEDFYWGPVQTNIHDSERQCFGIDWLEEYFDKLGDNGEPVSPLLTRLMDCAEEHGTTLIYV